MNSGIPERLSGFEADAHMFADAYAGRKVFVTGHTGFKGSWLSAWLLSLKANVTGFANSVPTHPACYEEFGLAGRIHNIWGDVRSLPSVENALASSTPEIVFHLAAQALVRDSYRDPVTTFETNMLGTLNILEAVRRYPGVKAVVVITSDKCYRNDEWVWGYRETDYLGGSDPYSASKGCAELISHAYFQSFFQNGAACATVRAGNVIGGGDWARDRIVPDCARAWFEGNAVRIRNPKATRPWQHVLEPLSGYLWLGARLFGNDAASPYDPRGQSYNFGPPGDAVYPVGEVAQALARHWPGFKYEIDSAGPGEMKESGLLKLCCDKALAELDWKAVLDFDETIRYTAEWYARFKADRIGMWDFSLGQIAAYVNAARNRGLKWAS